MQGMEWKPSGERISLLKCLPYKVIGKKYDNLSDRHDNLSHTQMSTNKENIWLCIIFT